MDFKSKGERGPVPSRRVPAKEEAFKDGDLVVYPTHGVGRVERISEEVISGHSAELILISFAETRMTLRVPVAKARTAGLRRVTAREPFYEVMKVLRGRPRVKRSMWSRRAQEYEAKINSGDPVALAEVVRDLYRTDQQDQSFSERQVYERAVERFSAELAAVDQTDRLTALTKVIDYLTKKRSDNAEDSQI